MKTVRYSQKILGKDGHTIEMGFEKGGVHSLIKIKLLEAQRVISNETSKFSHPKPVFSRLFLFRRGRVDLKYNGNEQILRSGKVYLLPSTMSFEVTYHRVDFRYLHLHVSDMSFRSIFSKGEGLLSLKDPCLFSEIWSSLEREDPLVLMGALGVAMGKILPLLKNDAFSNTKGISDQERVLKIIENSPPALVNINDMAMRLRLSRSTLSKNFHKSMGMTLKSYINERTLEQAKERLRYSEVSIETLSRELGFAHKTYFYRFFKEHSGLSPKRFRELGSQEFS